MAFCLPRRKQALADYRIRRLRRKASIFRLSRVRVQVLTCCMRHHRSSDERRHRNSAMAGDRLRRKGQDAARTFLPVVRPAVRSTAARFAAEKSDVGCSAARFAAAQLGVRCPSASRPAKDRAPYLPAGAERCCVTPSEELKTAAHFPDVRLALFH